LVLLLQALEKADTEGVVPYYIVLICYIMYAIPMVVVSALRWCDRLLKRSAGSSRDASEAAISAGGGATGRDSAAAHVGSRSPAAGSRFAAASGENAVAGDGSAPHATLAAVSNSGVAATAPVTKQSKSGFEMTP